MQITSLFHVAIKTARPQASLWFYKDVLGMSEAERPPFEFPGFWMQLSTPYGGAVFHVYTGKAALGSDGAVPTGSGALDHIALTACGFDVYKARFRDFGIPYRERSVPSMELWQLFAYDPNGIQFELNFHASAEKASGGQVDPDNFPPAGLEWFNPAVFERFEE